MDVGNQSIRAAAPPRGATRTVGSASASDILLALVPACASRQGAAALAIVFVMSPAFVGWRSAAGAGSGDDARIALGEDFGRREEHAVGRRVWCWRDRDLR